MTESTTHAPTERTDVPMLRDHLRPHLLLHRFAATRGVAENLTDAQIKEFIDRHLENDWSGLDEEDQQLNVEALTRGVSEEFPARIMSVFPAPNMAHLHDDKVWVITDAGWEVTTVLFPSEY